MLAFVAGSPSAELSVTARAEQLDRVEARLLEKESPEDAFARSMSRAYDGSFWNLQKRDDLRRLSNADLTLLFAAAQKVQFYTASPRYARDMQLDLTVLQERGRASELQYIELNDAFIESRLFAQARLLERAHPGAAIRRYHSPRGDVSVPVTMASAPRFRDETVQPTGPTALVVASSGRTLTRRNVALRAAAQIVVVISPECHFAQAGIRDIEIDPRLRQVFEKHATWLVPPYGSPEFESIANWNRTHPHVTMNVAYDVREWPMLDHWSTPTFYFLKNGKVTVKIAGWPPRGNKPQLISALTRIGLL